MVNRTVGAGTLAAGAATGNVALAQAGGRSLMQGSNPIANAASGAAIEKAGRVRRANTAKAKAGSGGAGGAGNPQTPTRTAPNDGKIPDPQAQKAPPASQDKGQIPPPNKTK